MGRIYRWHVTLYGRGPDDDPVLTPRTFSLLAPSQAAAVVKAKQQARNAGWSVFGQDRHIACVRRREAGADEQLRAAGIPGLFDEQKQEA